MLPASDQLLLKASVDKFVQLQFVDGAVQLVLPLIVQLDWGLLGDDAPHIIYDHVEISPSGNCTVTSCHYVILDEIAEVHQAPPTCTEMKEVH